MALVELTVPRHYVCPNALVWFRVEGGHLSATQSSLFNSLLYITHVTTTNVYDIMIVFKGDYNICNVSKHVSACAFYSQASFQSWVQFIFYICTLIYHQEKK